MTHKLERTNKIKTIFFYHLPIIVADCDAFPMSPDLLKPVDDNPGVLVWLWQYYFYFIKPMIPMSFIGARSKTWKSVLKYDGSVEDMIKYYNSIRYSFSFLGFLAYASLRLLA